LYSPLYISLGSANLSLKSKLPSWFNIKSFITSCGERISSIVLDAFLLLIKGSYTLLTLGSVGFKLSINRLSLSIMILLSLNSWEPPVRTLNWILSYSSISYNGASPNATPNIPIE